MISYSNVNKTKENGLILQVDFEKAFDGVSYITPLKNSILRKFEALDNNASKGIQSQDNT